VSQATKEAVTKAYHVAMSSEEYHAHPALGATMLETFRESRRKFHAIHITKTMAPKVSSPAMRLGTLVHMRLLEPGRYIDAIGDPMPEFAPDGTIWNKRLKAHREAWAEEEFKRASGEPVDLPTRNTVEAIAQSVLNNRHARRLLERHGEPEYSIFWTDPATGIECKLRVDWWSSIPIDIKTTRDSSPAAFAKQCVDLGYHVKRAHYMQGITAFAGPDLPMVHLAVGTEPPFSACCYDLDDTDSMGVSLGLRQWRSAMQSLAECMESDQWDEPYERQIVTLRLPGWAFQQDAYSFF